ncbi:MAG: uroporphyrinogen decarboxylase family protein [Clostridiales bacterium]|nr:uroporphyrinogen decarboxylase family protein [Clostridiales bacterium]
MATGFNTDLRDSQATITPPIAPEKFDLEAYADYEARLLESNRRFRQADSGLLVYRRFRADGVFYDQCRDFEKSLSLQLGALQASMAYKADIANFLEPWYGIGYIASCFGADYVWPPEQAPAVEPMFETCADILAADVKPIDQTPIGRHMLEMIEYFLDKTKGKLPISFTDIQSPLNMMSYLMPITDMFMEMMDEPEATAQVASLITDLLIDFLKKQQNLIGDCLARPGHGFASSRAFTGAGESDDNAVMISEDDYTEIFQPLDERIGAAFGGTVFHSCGNWGGKINMVKGLGGIVTADGAFSAQTDPSPNDPALFGEQFAGSGIVLNARAVGAPDEAFPAFQQLWKPNQKLICVTYCQTPEEQARLYDMLHSMEGANV